MYVRVLCVGLCGSLNSIATSKPNINLAIMAGLFYL